MRRRTTTKQLLEAITNGLLQITKAECSNKSSNRIDEISKETFLDSLAFINESGVFANFIDWHYERDLYENDGYVFDSGRMNAYAESVVIAYLRVCNGANEEEIERMLLFEEE